MRNDYKIYNEQVDLNNWLFTANNRKFFFVTAKNEAVCLLIMRLPRWARTQLAMTKTT